MDIRIKRTIQNFIFPGKKVGINPWAPAHLKLLVSDKSSCAHFAAFPKSGSNWTRDILSYYFIKKYTGEFQVNYEGAGETLKEREQKAFKIFGPADSRARFRQKVSEMLPGFPYDQMFHTHHCWKQTHLWFMDSARTIVLVRDIPSAIYSYYKQHELEGCSLEDVVKRDENICVDRAIRFFNSWGVFCEKRSTRSAVFKYEELRQDPLGQFTRMITNLVGACDQSLLKEALDFYSFEKQKQREYAFCDNEKKHFHNEGQLSYRDRIDEELYAYIVTELRKRLIYTFGYTY